MARQPLSRVGLGLLPKSLTTIRKSMQNEEKKMEKNLEVKIAFKICNHIEQLESIFWERYRDDFLKLNIEQVDQDLSQDDSQDGDMPF